eukprot:CAMPEP_0185205462 /NCGR_PEP_ID=MMETSP1140-20130426/56689_1 /TAXON_ID=298111 /ORGANISM="Pavlova sp., Strain CCMP459" /LENGTH=109 /DNA_ID=CAMNT_0027773063 /DNA_START=109 /DNA_END=440 /DNA_ORIENTATION=-
MDQRRGDDSRRLKKARISDDVALGAARDDRDNEARLRASLPPPSQSPSAAAAADDLMLVLIPVMSVAFSLERENVAHLAMLLVRSEQWARKGRQQGMKESRTAVAPIKR